MNVIRGIVNEHLVPVLPISIESEDNDWVEFELLLDTGSNGEIVLERSLPDRYCLAPQPPGKLRVSYELLASWGDWNHDAGYKLNILWGGQPKEASLHLYPMSPSVHGLMGTGLLSYQFLTVDVVQGGSVTIERADSRPEPRRMPWSRERRLCLWPSSIYNDEEYELWSHFNFPWTTLQVQDRKGGWRNLWVTVDTGDNGELSLPASCLNRLGLTLPRQSEIETVQGRETVKVGDAVVKWQGKDKPVKCRLRKDKPPLVGMKLLRGHRINMDFFYPGSPVEIGRIPRSARSEKGLVASLVDRLRF